MINCTAYRNGYSICLNKDEVYLVSTDNQDILRKYGELFEIDAWIVTMEDFDKYLILENGQIYKLTESVRLKDHPFGEKAVTYDVLAGSTKSFHNDAVMRQVDLVAIRCQLFP